MTLSLSTQLTLSRESHRENSQSYQSPRVLGRERPRPDALSTIREEGLEGRPSYITVAFHSRWMGRPGRFQALKRIVEHMLQFDDVWFATREQIAKHFAEVHPYEPEKFKKAKKIAGGVNGVTVNGNGITNGANGVKH